MNKSKQLQSQKKATIFGKIKKALTPVWQNSSTNLVSTSSNLIIREPYTGAWQRNDEISATTALAHFAVYSCVTLISQDIGKLPFILKRVQESGIWKQVNIPRYNKVLKNPNNYQNEQQFKEYWMVSKLITGNTYILKQRDSLGNVVKLYILDPSRVKVLVGDYQDVYYELSFDKLAKFSEVIPQSGKLVVPASEIVHDRCCPLFHPLLGNSPLFASALSASQGISMQHNAIDIFENGSRPGGILSAPGNIKQETLQELKEYFNTNFTGSNAGKIAVVSDGLTFSPLNITAEESQLIEQLKWSAETVCATFHVPNHKVLGNAPTYNNVEALNQEYYTQCLQTHINSMQELMDQALELDIDKDVGKLGVELDLNELFRMDTKTRYESYNLSINGGWRAPNEVRISEDLEPVAGGDQPMMQDQMKPIPDKEKINQLNLLKLANEIKATQDKIDNPPTPTLAPPEDDKNNSNGIDNDEDVDTIDEEDEEKILNEILGIFKSV